MASLRLAVPRAGFAFRSRQLQQLHITTSIAQSLRNASTERPPPPKPRVLEKPDKFRPPSHPSRLRSKTRYTYGPDLSQAQKTRRYPHMMPPEGTFMHWFITSRSVHLWISLGILVSLVIGVWLQDFIHNTPYQDMFPPRSMIFSHPFAYIGRWFEVYNLHVAYVSAQTAEKRKQKVDDVRKRSEYRKAHGLDQDDGMFGGWTAQGDGENKKPVLVEGGAQLKSSSGPETAVGMAPATTQNENIVGQAGESEEIYTDFEGKRQTAKKRWFGIW